MTNDPGSGGPPAGSAPREIGILAVTGFELLDLAGPLSLFASATWDGSNDGRPAYRCRVIGLERGPVAASIGTTLFADTAQIGRAHVELQSLMRISYAVFCLKKKKKNQPCTHTRKHKTTRSDLQTYIHSQS